MNGLAFFQDEPSMNSTTTTPRAGLPTVSLGDDPHHDRISILIRASCLTLDRTH